MADPLTLLREFTKNKKPVILQNDRLIFDKVSFPRNTETAYRSRKGEGEPYTLDAIYFLLQQPKDQKYKDYLNECRAQNFPRVSLVDKKFLIDYLTGVSDTCPYLVSVVPPPSFGDEESKKRAADEVESEDSIQLKKQKLEEKEEIKEAKKHFIDRLERQLKKRREDKSDEVPALGKSKFLDVDAAVTRGIISKERLLRTRTTILQSQKKHFTGIIEAVMNNYKKESQKKKTELKPADSKKVAYDRYQDVQEEKFWKDRLKLNEPEDFQIDTRGTFAGGGGLPDVTQLQQPAKPKPTPPKPTSSASSPHKPKEEKRPNIPIIIVPSALTSLITLFNARDFLGEGVFVNSLEKKNSGAKKEAVVGLLRKKGDVTLKYHILDNTSKLTPKDWNNVVAVFALGATWQFKNWYWSTPVEIFNNLAGFFLSYEDEEPPETIKSWPVKVLSVSKTRTKKHVAQTACVEFWKIVDQHVRTRKPNHFPPQYYTTDSAPKKI